MKNPKTLIVTSPSVYNASLCQALQKNGLRSLPAPVIETLLFDNPAFDPAFLKIKDYKYIILPSKTAINSFLFQLEKRKIHPEIIPARFIAIGKDYEYLKEKGFTKILKPSEPSTKGIVELISKIGKDQKILLTIPRVEIIKEPGIVPRMIRDLNRITKLDILEAYITRPVQSLPVKIKNKILQGQYDLIALASGGEAMALKYLFPQDYKNFKIACFGPYTMKTAVNEGFKPLLTGKKFSSFSDFSSEISSFLQHR